MFWFWVMIWIGLVCLILLVRARQWLGDRQRLVKLVLTPPLVGDQSAASTTDLFIALVQLIRRRTAWERLVGFHPTWNLAIRASKDGGCQFIWKLPKGQRQSAERLLVGYWPEMKIKANRSKRLCLKTVARFTPVEQVDQGLPDWGQSDPLGYLTSQLGKIGDSQPIAYRIDLRTKTGILNWSSVGDWLLKGLSRLADGLLTIWHPNRPGGHDTGPTDPLKPQKPAERPDLSASISLAWRGSQKRTGWGGLWATLALLNLKHKRFGRWSQVSAQQLAGLWHFPHSEGSPADGLAHSLSKTLPVPVELLPEPRPADLILGNSNHRGESRPLYLKPADRQRHVYIVGGTGTGKTTMLKDHIIQDMTAGRGVGVIDPHGDLASELLDFVPAGRVDDLIYIDPDDFKNPAAINLLEIPPGLSGDERNRQKDLVTESTVSVLRKLFAADGEGGHRVEYILRNSIQTVLETPNPTLFTIYRLLQNPKFRQETIANLANNNLRLFWDQELGRAGDFQRVKMTAGVTAKIGRFLFSTPARLVFGQPKSTIDFGQIMDGNKILICDLSRGKLGEDTSRLFGSVLLAKIQLAALARVRQTFSARQPFYLYVDEFQNFATTSFVEMLSESRKYQVLLTIAEQSTQQQLEQKLTEVILANTGTIVAFRSGSPEDARMVGPLLEPFVGAVELINLPAYHFYARLGCLNPTEAISGKTRVLSSQEEAKCNPAPDNPVSPQEAGNQTDEQLTFLPPPKKS